MRLNVSFYSNGKSYLLCSVTSLLLGHKLWAGIMIRQKEEPKLSGDLEGGGTEGVLHESLVCIPPASLAIQQHGDTLTSQNLATTQYTLWQLFSFYSVFLNLDPIRQQGHECKLNSMRGCSPSSRFPLFPCQTWQPCRVLAAAAMWPLQQADLGEAALTPQKRKTHVLHITQ